MFKVVHEDYCYILMGYDRSKCKRGIRLLHDFMQNISVQIDIQQVEENHTTIP